MAWTQIFQDLFARANSATLGNGWTADSHFSINANMLRFTPTDSGVYYATRPTGENAIDSRAVVQWNTAPGQMEFAQVLRLRMNAGQTDGYEGQWYVNSSGGGIGTLKIDRVLGAVTIGSTSMAFGYVAGRTYELDFSIVGNTLSLTVIDPVAATSVTITGTDGNVPAAGQFGLGFYSAPGNTYDITNFTSYSQVGGNAVVNQAVVPVSTTQNITLSGSGTAWAGGTTSFTASGVAGVTINSTTIVNATNATLNITTGAAAGTVTITESGTGATTCSFDVANYFLSDNASMFWSPGAYYTDPGHATHMNYNGNGFKVGFSGTSFALYTDLSQYKAAGVSAVNWPILLVQVDNAVLAQIPIFDPGSGVKVAKTVLATGLAGGAHNVQVWQCHRGEYNTFGKLDTTTMGKLLLQGVAIDVGAALSAPSGAFAVKPNRLIVIGDSITHGYDTLSPDGTLNVYPMAAFPTVMGMGLNAEVAQIGMSGQGWTTPGNTWNDTLPNTYGSYFQGQARTFPTAVGLSVIVFAEGTNDGATDVTSTVQAQILAARGSAPGWWLFYQSPFNDTHAGEIAAAVAAYKAAHPGDSMVDTIRPHDFMPVPVNSGTAANFWTVDQIHPINMAHAWAGAIGAAEIRRKTAAPGSTGRTRRNPTRARG